MNESRPDERNITGIPKEFPEAVTALSTFGTTAVTEVGNLGRYIGWIFGTVPTDAVGLLLGDPLRTLRTLAAAWYDEKVRENLGRRGIKETRPVSLSIGIPLIRAAYDESRPGLRELWAELIANAMDPNRSGRIRLSFIETLKRFDPMDAVVLKERIIGPPGSMSPSVAEFFANRLVIPLTEVMLSVDILTVLNCVHFANNARTNYHPTEYGKALIRACSE